VDRRLAADPLDVACAALASPGDGALEPITAELAADGRVEGAAAGDAEGAAQVAAGEIEQVRGHEFQFFAVLDAMAEDARRDAGFARADCARAAIDAAAVLAERAMLVVSGGAIQAVAIGPKRRRRHRWQHVPLKSRWRAHHGHRV
jgi:hypothetical protein